MIYWVIYDITKNKIRTKISNICKDYGLERVQKSSFLGNISVNKAEMLALDIKKFMKNKKDKVFIVPSGKEDFAKKFVFGYYDNKIVEREDVIFIS